MTASAPHRPWYREPMLWLVIALPAAVIVAGVSTIAIAVSAGGSDAVSDQVRRTAQIQIADLAAEQAALERGIGAELRIDHDTGALHVALNQQADAPAATLELQLNHPIDAAQDRQVTLVRSGDGWLGRFDGDLQHDWDLSLMPADREWRLRGRIRGGQPSAELRAPLANG